MRKLFLTFIISLMSLTIFCQKVIKTYYDDYLRLHILEIKQVNLNGVENGIYKQFYYSGIIEESGNFSNGKRVGIWKNYNENGGAYQQYKYDEKGNLLRMDELPISNHSGFEIYDPKRYGEISFGGQPEPWVLVRKTFWANGQLQEDFVDGKYQKLYNEQGQHVNKYYQIIDDDKKEINNTQIISEFSNNTKKDNNDSQSIVTVFAGNGKKDYSDGYRESASFHSPSAVTTDGKGNIYVADTKNYKIRKIDKNGKVTTIKINSADNPPFGEIMGISLDSIGNIFISDWKNHVLRKIQKNGNISTYAGNGNNGIKDGTKLECEFNDPVGIVFDNKGNMFICDASNYLIRKINTNGVVSTFAGSNQGFLDGKGKLTQFWLPIQLAVDSKNNLYVCDGQILRKILPDGTVNLFCGEITDGKSSIFQGLSGITVDDSDNVYVTDRILKQIIKVTKNGKVIPFVGYVERSNDYGNNSSSRNVIEASLIDPFAITYDKFSKSLFVCDGQIIKKIKIQL